MFEPNAGQHSSKVQDGTMPGSHRTGDSETADRQQAVSVCMATWNGSRFLQEQLTDILTQLTCRDELVVVDDGSSDDTMEILERAAAEASHTRVRIYRNDKNLGAIRTFERALGMAEKDLVFLSDQDDRWLPDKVFKIKEAFAAHPEVTLVLTDAQIIDGSGAITAGSWVARRQFQAGTIANVVRNSFLGCTMAFRRSSLEYCLPFPVDTPMHDQWIGTLHSIFGSVVFLPEPLMQYRRHDANVTKLHPASVSQMLRWRFSLFRNLVARYRLHSRHGHLRS
jgi:glycosyltransferase involved in cell wall biosynthesis